MIPSSRDLVLGRIRGAIGAARTDAETAALVQRRSEPPRWTRPAFAGDDVARFIAKAEASLCTVSRAQFGDVAASVSAVIGDRPLPSGVSISPSLRGVAWSSHWQINYGAGRREEAVAITDALAGVAETGSIVVCSEAARPASLNFLPDLHVAVLRARDIVHHLEDIWPKVRALPVWPRAVNIISAPSRTADVAQIVVRPAHGPKALHIVLVGDAA